MNICVMKILMIKVYYFFDVLYFDEIVRKRCPQIKKCALSGGVFIKKILFLKSFLKIVFSVDRLLIYPRKHNENDIIESK